MRIEGKIFQVAVFTALALFLLPGAGSAFAADWAANFGGFIGQSAYANAQAVDAAGNVYIAGYFNGTKFPIGSVTLSRIGNQDAFVAKLDPAGTVLWAKNFGGSGASVVGYSLAMDGSGNVYLSGDFSGANLTTPALTKIGASDAFVMKLDTTGAITWAKNFGGSGANAVGRSIAVDISGNVYLGGDFTIANLSTPALTKIGSSDAFALKLDVSGNTTWAKNFGGSGAWTYGHTVAVDISGNVYLGGQFSSANLTTPALTKIGIYDAFAFKLDSLGATTWAKNFGGSGAGAYSRCIAVDSFGNVYLGGYFTAANLSTPALTKIGASDAFAFKLDSLGATTWAKNFGGSGASVVGYSIAVDISGNVYLGGYFTTANLSTPALTKIGSQDAFALKLDVSGNTTWAKNLGGSGAYAYGNSIAVDISGNVYLGGYFQNASLTIPALNKIGVVDAFVFKFDPTGSVTWANNFCSMSPGSAYTNATAVDAAGNVYIAGYFDVSRLTMGSVILSRIGNQDAFVAKLDPAGTVLWAKNFGGSGASVVGYSLAMDGSGNVYLGGYFTAANLTTPALTKIGASDAFVMKLDTTGAVTWAKNFGGSGASAVGRSIAVDISGNVYLGGYFTVANLSTPALTKIGSQDAFALKLDASGNTTWAKNFGGSGAYAYSNSIAVDISGNVYLGGYFDANLTTPVLSKIGVVDAFVFKLNTSGNTTWAKKFGGSGAYAYGNSITVDGSGNVYLGGYFYSTNLTTPALTKIGGQDAFAMKLDSTGAVTWAKNFGGSGASVVGYSIAVDNSGNVYLGGYFYNTNLTTPALTKIGTYDACALKLDPTGVIAWAKNFGGSGAAVFGVSIAVDSSGNVYLGGYLQGSNLTTPALSKIGSNDAYILAGYDAAGPTGAIFINADGAYTNSTSVTLTLSCTDASGCSQMILSNDGVFDTEVVESYSATKAWTLTSGNGTKTVYAKFKDGAGNWSGAYTDTIVLDTLAPVVSAGSDKTTNASITQTATATDATPMTYLWTKESGPGTITFGTSLALSTTVSADADGTYTLRFTATDALGYSAYSEVTLVWDTTAPTLNAAASYVDSTHVDVTISEAVNGALTSANYTGNNGLTISGVSSQGGNVYRLTTSLQAIGGSYTITANNMADLAGNAIDAAAKTATFTRTANSAPSIPVINIPENATEVTELTPALTVNTSTDADGDLVTYTFEVSPASDFSSGSVIASGITATTWVVSPALADNTTYYWRALASDGSTNSNWMSTASFFVNTANDAPGSPAVSLPADNTHVATLTPVLSITNATDMDNDALTYDFDVASDSGFTNIVGSAAGTVQGTGTTSWTVSPSLNDNATYYWRARARDEHGAYGNYASAAFFVNTANDAPTAPATNSPANASEITTTTPALVINNATDIDGDSLSYIFELDTVNTFDSSNKQTSSLIAEGADATSWTPATLSDNTTWYWRAKANDGLADGPWMITASFFVNTANDAPSAPTLLNPADNGSVTVLTPTLSLNAAADIDNDTLTYDFEVYSDSGLVSLVTSTTGAGTSWIVDTALSDNTSYWWRARAKDEHGAYGGWMAAKSFYVNNNGYDDPPAITITKPGASEPIVYGDSFTITWTDSDPDSNAAITLYYDTDNSGNDGMQIATGISEDDSANSYTWDVSALPVGTYYVYARIDDGTTVNYAYSAGPVIRSNTDGDIDNSGAVDIADALMALRIAAGIITPTASEISHGDAAPIINGTPQPDGAINIGDVVVILRKSVGLVIW